MSEIGEGSIDILVKDVKEEMCNRHFALCIVGERKRIYHTHRKTALGSGWARNMRGKGEGEKCRPLAVNVFSLQNIYPGMP